MESSKCPLALQHQTLFFTTIGHHCNKHLNCFSACLVLHNIYYVNIYKLYNNISETRNTLLSWQKKHCSLCTRNILLSWQEKETLFPMHKKYFVVSAKETLFPVHKKHFVVLAGERSIVPCVQETLCCLGKRKKHCFYTQETLCCLCRRKKHCSLCARNALLSWQKKETLSLCTRNTLLSWQEKEALFPVCKKRFVVLAKERNTVPCAQEILCCLGRRKKHCSLCARNALLSWQKKETLFSIHKKHFVVLAEERNTVPCIKETLCFSAEERNTVSFAQGTMFLSLAKTTKCFFCTRTVFLLHREQCFFLLPRKQSVSCAQGIVFLSSAETTSVSCV